MVGASTTPPPCNVAEPVWSQYVGAEGKTWVVAQAVGRASSENAEVGPRSYL